MNESIATTDSLLAVAQHLFAERGFDGSSVREITAAAGANLGAVTYHFGSKNALYHAVLERALVPFRERLAQAASGSGPPLDRIDRVLRTLFEYLGDHPDVPRLMVRQLTSGDDLPPVVRTTMQANIRLIARLIQAGQQDGTVRGGDPQLMALSVGAQPVFLALVRHALRQAVSLNQSEPATRQALTDSVAEFVQAGLRAEKGETP